MACFLVPTAEAIITTIAEKAMVSKENKEVNSKEGMQLVQVEHTPFSKKLKWLNNMLWGGSALLAFEHVWHGEVVPFFPFLTAASNKADAAKMLHEMSTTGVGMAVLTTIVWAGMVVVSSKLEKEDSVNALSRTVAR